LSVRAFVVMKTRIALFGLHCHVHDLNGFDRDPAFFVFLLLVLVIHFVKYLFSSSYYRVVFE
jgi:hypothetical protein